MLLSCSDVILGNSVVFFRLHAGDASARNWKLASFTGQVVDELTSSTLVRDLLSGWLAMRTAYFGERRLND